MINTICIISQSHLCRNPRVLKEAITLAVAKYNVHIVTSIISTELYHQDLSTLKPYANISLHVVSDLSKFTFQSFTDRLLSKIGRLLNKSVKIETILSLGYGSMRYFQICKTIRADLYICHQEIATYIGTNLINSGLKVAFDFEDWYSEDLLPEARNERPVKLLQRAESIALKKGVFCLTTSNSLAKRLADVYLCPKPTVIYNVFPSPIILSKKSNDFSRPLKLFWFSQTIGEGRGLEHFLPLLASMKCQFEIHLLGNVSAKFRDQLNFLLPAHHQLYFHHIVEEQYLAEKIQSFDIGLALELDKPPSRNFTITNKFFQYVQSGLPVITSETMGQNEAFEKLQPGFQIPQNPTRSKINELEDWLNDTGKLQLARKKAIEASKYYNWEIESKKLVQVVKNVLEK